jgi:chromosome segregation ATPase
MRGWSDNDRPITEDDVRTRRLQLREIEEETSLIQEKLDVALEKNNNLAVFRQASLMASTKLREKEMEVERLTEEKNKIIRQTEEKEAQVGGAAGMKKGLKQELLKFGAEVRGKMEPYQRMKAEISSLQSELVVLQRTETILKSRDKNLDSFLDELEKKKGVVVRDFPSSFSLSLSLSLSLCFSLCLCLSLSLCVCPLSSDLLPLESLSGLS